MSNRTIIIIMLYIVFFLVHNNNNKYANRKVYGKVITYETSILLVDDFFFATADYYLLFPFPCNRNHTIYGSHLKQKIIKNTSIDANDEK